MSICCKCWRNSFTCKSLRCTGCASLHCTIAGKQSSLPWVCRQLLLQRLLLLRPSGPPHATTNLCQGIGWAPVALGTAAPLRRWGCLLTCQGRAGSSAAAAGGCGLRVLTPGWARPRHSTLPPVTAGEAVLRSISSCHHSRQASAYALCWPARLLSGDLLGCQSPAGIPGMGSGRRQCRRRWARGAAAAPSLLPNRCRRGPAPSPWAEDLPSQLQGSQLALAAGRRSQ
jgi:hypothetical protein